MNRVAIALYVVAALAGPLQAAKVSTIEGFQTTRWGDSIATTKAKLGKKFKADGYADDGTPMFVGDFGGYRQCNVYTSFKAGKLYKVQVTVWSQGGKNTKDLFFETFSKLQKVYGLPTAFAISYYNEDHVVGPMQLKQMSENEVTALETDIMAGRAYAISRWDYSTGTGVVLRSMREQPREGSNLFLNIDYYSKAMEKAAEDATLDDF